MCYLGIFTTVIYLSFNILRTQGTLRHPSDLPDRLFYRTLCKTRIFRTQSIFRTLSNNYDEKFYSQHYVTLTYLEPWYIQNWRHIQNTAKRLSRNNLFKNLFSPGIFRTLVYSELWYFLKSNHIQNPAEYLKWDILLRTLWNCRRFRGPIY